LKQAADGSEEQRGNEAVALMAHPNEPHVQKSDCTHHVLLIDTGASHHIINDRDFFVKLHDSPL
jgi:hypothetical protein